MLNAMGAIPKTLRGQITIMILFAVVTAISAGRAFENFSKNAHAVPNLEVAAGQARTVALVLAQASPEERVSILASARRAGFEVSLAPISLATRFTVSPEVQGVAGTVIDWLSPPQGDAPLGGWRAFLDNRRVIAQKVDDQTILMFFGVPDTVLTSSFLVLGSYYFIAVIVLIGFFFVFAIRTITEPLRKIAEAAIGSDISVNSQIFDERGTKEIVSLARALNNMRNRIRLMIDSRTRMLRGISHDVRTPLTRIRLRIDRMEEGPLRETLLADIDHINRLLAESLNYLRDDYATEIVERVDVASILQTVCNDFSDVGFEVAYEGPNKFIANCRPLSIARAVTNLCDNAVKFASEVRVCLEEDEAGFSISVADDGPGIPEALREKVFEPFFKGDASRTGQSGFGLGLSIVADIAHSHRGTVALLPGDPRGLVARVIVPRLAIQIAG